MTQIILAAKYICDIPNCHATAVSRRGSKLPRGWVWDYADGDATYCPKHRSEALS
jgi:hypothetical protein